MGIEYSSLLVYKRRRILTKIIRDSIIRNFDIFLILSKYNIQLIMLNKHPIIIFPKSSLE